MLWVKAFHIISAVTWFAALFYLPRLFVYHASAQDEVSIKRFKLMERRLYYGIMTPSLIVVQVLGLTLLFAYGYLFLQNAYWLHVKLLLNILLIIYHFYCGYWLHMFSRDGNTHSENFYRIVNELPVVALVIMVVLAVVKPF